jgi:hypothetical protein
MNKEQQELLDESYENFIDKTKGLNLNLKINRDIIVVEGPVYNATPRLLIKEEFIDKCKTDPEFSEKWGLKIYTKVDGDKVWMGMVYNDNAVEIRLK